MAQVVLVTGVSRYLGSRLAARLAADPSVERVIGVDTVPPSHEDLQLLGRAEFVRADIRNPLIARVIGQADVSTVVHASLSSSPDAAGGSIATKETNVLGTMQLLAACQKAESVRRVVVKSTTAVYGRSPRDPAIFTEDMPAKSVPGTGYTKDAVELEEYVRGFIRRRPEIDVTVLRFAGIVGPFIDSPLTSYLRLPVVPTGFGLDPRLQLLHEADAIEILRLATMSSRPGTFNAAGDGTLLLSQALRRAGRLSLPVPTPAVSVLGSVLRHAGMGGFTPDQLELLNFGRVVSNARLKAEFGYQPIYTTSQAFAAFLAGKPVRQTVRTSCVDALADSVCRLLRLPAVESRSLAGGHHG